MNYQLISIGPPPEVWDPKVFRDFTPGEEPDLSHKNPPLKWVPVVDGSIPTYDPDLEYITTAPDVVTLTEVTRTYVKVAYTAEELVQRADDADRDAKMTNVGNSVATLRAWAVDAEGTTVTQGNAVATVQTVVTRLGVFFDRFADLIEGRRFDQEP